MRDAMRKSYSPEIYDNSSSSQVSFFKPIEWNVESYVCNSSPQIKLALDTIENDNWFSNFIDNTDLSEINVIDLGCGNGTITMLLTKKYPKVHFTGVNLSWQMIQEANKYKEPNLHFLCLDIADESFTLKLGKKFDCILSFSAIHWVKNQIQLCENIRAIANPSAQLCLMLYQRDNYLWETIEKTALSKRWVEYFMPYESPYYGITKELIKLLAENKIFISSDIVYQEYQNGGDIQLKKYLFGITPIYAQLQCALDKNSDETKELIQEFLDDVIHNLKCPSYSGKQSTYVTNVDGSSRFNYTRIVFRGILQQKVELNLSAGQSPSRK